MEGEERGEEDGGDMKEGEQTSRDQFERKKSFLGLYCHYSYIHCALHWLFGNHFLHSQDNN